MAWRADVNQRIEAAVREILLAIGEDPDREELAATPHRVAEAYAELFAGVGVDPLTVLGTPFPAETHDLVVLRDIRLRSICEHHLLPFAGVAHIAYEPGSSILGLSKIPDLVEVLGARPQLQERLTAQIADTIASAIDARGVWVMLDCQHQCVTMRGGKQPDARAVTVAARGVLSSPTSRDELAKLLRVDDKLDPEPEPEPDANADGGSLDR